MSERVAVLGASPKEERYSNQAVRLLLVKGHQVFPVHPLEIDIHGIKANKNIASLHQPIDTLTLYVGPSRLTSMVDEIIRLNPGRVLFNPGTESEDIRAQIEAAGINTENVCTLVLLRTGQF